MPLESTPSVDPLLSQTALEWFQNQEGYIASIVAPVFQSGIQSGDYYVFEKENMLFTGTDLERAPGTPYKEFHMRLASDSFTTKDRGAVYPVDDSERAKYRNAWDADAAAVQLGVKALLNDRETRLQSLLSGATTNTRNMTNVTDANSGNLFIEEIRAEMEVIHKRSGITPNVLVLPRDNWVDDLSTDADLFDRIKTTFPNEGARPTLEMLARLIEIDRIVIPSAIEATSNEATATITTDYIFPSGEGYLMYVAPPNAPLSTPSAVRTFTWTEQGGEDLVVESYRKEEIRSDMHRVRSYDDMKVVSTDLLTVLQTMDV